MKFFKKRHDGGKDSGVTGYWLIEWKGLFSIVLLRFSKGSREAFHSHAFNALTWWIKGAAVEYIYFEEKDKYKQGKYWSPSFIPKYTPKDCFHKIITLEVTWALSFRGPWSKTWKEAKNGEVYTLSSGRIKVK